MYLPSLQGKYLSPRQVILISCLLLIVPLDAYAQTSELPPIRKDDISVDAAPDIRATNIQRLITEAKTDPIAMATSLDKSRWLDDLLEAREYDAAARIALLCVNGQPGRIDRLDYFLSIRFRALMAAKKFPEALSLSHSYYNVCAVGSGEKAIDMIAQALKAAYPDKPELAKRFKLQQYAGASNAIASSVVKEQDLGEDIFSTIPIIEEIYVDTYAKQEKNRSWRAIGEANVLLLQNKPEDAMAMIKLLELSKDVAVKAAYKDAYARTLKALSGTLGEANKIIAVK